MKANREIQIEKLYETVNHFFFFLLFYKVCEEGGRDTSEQFFFIDNSNNSQNFYFKQNITLVVAHFPFLVKSWERIF